MRVLGVDSPELARDGHGEECGATAAARLTRRLVEGRTVTPVPDDSQADTDRYGRLLRYVDLTDDRDLSQVLLERGWARVYAPAGDVDRHDVYVSAQMTAREAGEGMWGRCGP